MVVVVLWLVLVHFISVYLFMLFLCANILSISEFYRCIMNVQYDYCYKLRNLLVKWEYVKKSYLLVHFTVGGRGNVFNHNISSQCFL